MRRGRRPHHYHTGTRHTGVGGERRGDGAAREMCGRPAHDGLAPARSHTPCYWSRAVRSASAASRQAP